MNTDSIFNKDYLPIWCEQCERLRFLFVDNPEQICFVICKRCGQETAQVYCPKCEMGGDFIRNIAKHPSYWVCSKCKTRYALPADFYEKPNYLYGEEELPSETRDRIRKTVSSGWSLTPKQTILVIVYAGLFLAAWFLPSYLIFKQLERFIGIYSLFLSIVWFILFTIIISNEKIRGLINTKFKKLMDRFKGDEPQ